MDVKHIEAEPTADERAAVDAVVGPPTSQWDGGERTNDHREAHTSLGGASVRARRHELVPALHALQARIGWISEGGLGYVCERLGVPPADAWGVATFYALFATTPRPMRVLHVCNDIACRSAGSAKIEDALERSCGHAIHGAPAGDRVELDQAKGAWMHSPCLGLCDMAPAALLTVAGELSFERLYGAVTPELATRLFGSAEPPVDSSADPAIPQRGSSSLSLLRRVGVVDPTSLAAYQAAGGFSALAKARQMGAEAVVLEVTESKLVGRGGAAFPTGRKWEAVRTQPNTPHYLVCNADESEPGTFKDRLLLTHDPFGIVEAMTIAGFATGSQKGYLYVRAEYPLAFARMSSAVQQSRDAGLLNDFDIEIRRGAGAYICGEETALFESIEGKRGEPRSKPPFPVNAGLFQKPTVVNNVETLANVIPILLMGGAAYAKTGTAQSTGTRLFCLSGAVSSPGVYEVPCGTALSSLLQLAGAEPNLSALLLGGAAGTFIRADEIDIELSMEGSRAANATLGSGVIMAFGASVDIKQIVLRIAEFFRDESCGQCVPCRVGTVRQEESLHRIAARQTIGNVRTELALLDEVGLAMKDASICGLGQTAYAVVESAIKRLKLYDEASA